MLQSARLRYCRPVNHSSWISARTAEINFRTESSLGKISTTRVRGLSSNGTEMYAKGVDRYLPEMRLRRIQE